MCPFIHEKTKQTKLVSANRVTIGWIPAWAASVGNLLQLSGDKALWQVSEVYHHTEIVPIPHDEMVPIRLHAEQFH
jgi:hypothetical protein